MTDLVCNDTVKSLIEGQALLVRQLEAKQKRIDHLEFILEQRVRATKNEFNPDSINAMCQKVYAVFQANPGIGFTYDEFPVAFKDYHGWANEHLPQRIRDLRQAGLVWSDEESTPKRFYLKLKPLENEKKHET
jgi:hypothetical protein